MTKAPTQSGNTSISRSFQTLTREAATNPDIHSMRLGKTVSWDHLLDDPRRVLILSAAGTGKTHECQQQAERLFEQGKAAFFLTLEGIASTGLPMLLAPPHRKRYQDWLAGKHPEAYFFLDSADELLLAHGDFRRALRKFHCEIEGHLHRARIIVTSRPITLDFDAVADELPLDPPRPEPEIIDTPEQSFRRLISGETRNAQVEARKKRKTPVPDDGVLIVELTPLSQQHVEHLATTCGVTDLAGLVQEIERKHVWEFAQRPQELIQICSYWRQHRRLGTRSEQIEEDIRNKLQETGNRKQHTTLSPERAREGAERLALAQVLTRKRTIRFSDLSLDDSEQEAAIDPAIILSDWTVNEQAELLQRPLFGPASYGRVRFHHRSASEFLAAQRLEGLHRSDRISRSALFRLLFGDCHGQHLVFPSMRPVAAWLSIPNDAVRDEMLRRDPAALMDDGDPERFPVSTRQRILTAYVQRYGQDRWRGLHIPTAQVIRFASPDLSPTVRQLWWEGKSSPDVRELLLALILAGRMQDCRDIASEVVTDPAASPADRIAAFTALAEMTEPGGLDPVVTSLLTESHWPPSVKSGVLDTVFPRHMSSEQFAELLGQIVVAEDDGGNLDWFLPQLILRLGLTDKQSAALRTSLSRMIKASIEPSDAWPYFTSRLSHLSVALAALCEQHLDITQHPSAGIVSAAVIVVRLQGDDFGNQQPVEALRSFFRQAPSHWRKAAYCAEVDFCTTHIPASDSGRHWIHVSYDSTVDPLRANDFGWLLEIIADTTLPNDTRTSAFQDACRMLCHDGLPIKEREEAIREAAKGEPDWLDQLAPWLAPIQLNTFYGESQARQKEKNAAREAKEEEAIASWETWRAELLDDPDAYFAKTSIAQVVWDFARVIGNVSQNSTWRYRWNREIIANHFNEQITEKVRKAFCAYWRTIDPQLPSERPEEQRNCVEHDWILALAGVYAEAEQPDWVHSLDRDTAERAARLASVELNGLPAWLNDLITFWSDAVNATLGTELSLQLDDVRGFSARPFLDRLVSAGVEVQKFFVPRVWNWLSTKAIEASDEHDTTHLYRHLEQVIHFVISNTADPSAMIALAESRLGAGLDTPFAPLWLVLLLETAPQAAIKTLADNLATLDPTVRSHLCQTLFSTCSPGDNSRLCCDLSNPEMTPEILLALVQIAYREVRVSDDIERVGTGAYRPTLRDKAQHGRSAVLTALLNRTGPAAWVAKQTLRTDPFFAHLKDRIDQLAREKAAGEAEGPAYQDQNVTQLEKWGEGIAINRNGMFDLMINRLADLQHDIAAHEFSERSLLATTEKEKDMQLWFAKRLQERENSLYRIDREAMVINDKETDIRLLSRHSDAQAVIEMKLANNGYSLNDLEQALEKQLVGQYMQHDSCRAGCLLITMNKARTWKNQQNGAVLDFTALISHLQQQARELEKRMNHEIRLAVIGIDLT